MIECELKESLAQIRSRKTAKSVKSDRLTGTRPIFGHSVSYLTSMSASWPHGQTGRTVRMMARRFELTVSIASLQSQAVLTLWRPVTPYWPLSYPLPASSPFSRVGCAPTDKG